MKNRAIGDSILGLSSISYIKSIFSNAKVVYAVPKIAWPLYKEVDTDANEIIPVSFKTPLQWLLVFIKLKKRKFNLIIELHQGGRTAKFFKLFSFLTRTSYFYHNHHLKKGSFIPDQGMPKAYIQRDLDGLWPVARKILGKSSGYLPSYLDYAPKLTVKNSIKRSIPAIVLGVSASREEKIWPLTFFAKLSKLLLERNKNIEILIPFSASKFEQDMQREMTAYSLPSQVILKKVLLDKLPRFVDRASLYIGNDTGLKHLCVALGMKSCTFFGPSDHPLEWHPYDTKNHPFFHPDKDLEGNLFLGECDLKRASFLEQLRPEDVFSKLNYFLEKL